MTISIVPVELSLPVFREDEGEELELLERLIGCCRLSNQRLAIYRSIYDSILKARRIWRKRQEMPEKKTCAKKRV